MTRITQSDHVLLLLQEQLQRLGRSRTGRPGTTSGSRKATASPMTRLQSLAALDQMSDEDVRRTLVRALLSEELGESLANDSNFQIVVDDVYRIIEASDEGRALIERATTHLRGAR